MGCPYATTIGSVPDGGDGTKCSVVCSVIVEMVGIKCGMPLEACRKCKYPKDNSFVQKIAKRHIRNLLISGNQPRFADAVDVPAMVKRFMPMSTKEEREEVVGKAVINQSTPPEKGGHTAGKVLINLRELELELDVPGTLAEAGGDTVEAIEQLQERHGDEWGDCVHEGPLINMKHTSCCGFVRVFRCHYLQRDVWHTKCCSCEFYTEAL